ncbi:histidine triad (HIT) protein [Melioribacter roseus P3M-2]|uniref:Histidine triad (HIT) protein n=1 Tax=Melioribacter roseus (strain DSM 23840 / JCM 17771 / VKM B-2668 / P3M-2) TaxID=1191523 RepID=I7A444_MELRP|nr:HIT domain-containing protein [Melioribacter roseus]AFN75958.1 histidine triad (HIT) protein [Melioribacter roseus P3M-2]
MERLWSPWRSQYIESFKDKKQDETCIFCDAVNEKIEDERSLKVYNADVCFVMLNLYPYNSGHLMVIPNRHLSSFDNLTEEEMNRIMQVTQLSMKALDLVMKPHGFNFGANLGKAAGAGIDEHIHFHIVPRWNGDTNFFPVLGDVKVISQDLLQTKSNLIEAYSKLTTNSK